MITDQNCDSTLIECELMPLSLFFSKSFQGFLINQRFNAGLGKEFMLS